MPRLLKPVISLLLLIVLSACVSANETKPASTPGIPTSSETVMVSNTPESSLQNRFGTITLEPVNDSGVTGTFTSQDNGDGPTDAAGAVVTGQTAQRAESLGLLAADYLSRNDPYPFFNALGDLLKTGPTGTNVNDLLFLFAL